MICQSVILMVFQDTSLELVDQGICWADFVAKLLVQNMCSVHVDKSFLNPSSKLKGLFVGTSDLPHYKV